jgi:DivIVA domain-containing protein
VVALVILALVAAALVVTVLGVASGRIPVDPLAEAVHTTPDTGLPEEPTASDVDAVRFDTAMRGYRVDEVDAHLETLREELAERERALSDLRSQPSREPMPPEASTAPSTAVPPAVSPNRSDGG